jgi:aminoglycoside phosphotransferase (APT) family kinase protein
MGIVDREMATVGDPLAELGRILALWCQDGTPRRAAGALGAIAEGERFL